MSVAYGKGAKGKATRLHSLVVRHRGACQRCGSMKNLQCAHIISRKFSATRTDERNAWCLCASCHRRLTDWPNEHMAFVYVTIGEELFEVLKRRALDNPRPWRECDWQEEVNRLQAIMDSWED